MFQPAKEPIFKVIVILIGLDELITSILVLALYSMLVEKAIGSGT